MIAKKKKRETKPAFGKTSADLQEHHRRLKQLQNTKLEVVGAGNFNHAYNGTPTSHPFSYGKTLKQSHEYSPFSKNTSKKYASLENSKQKGFK